MVRSVTVKLVIVAAIAAIAIVLISPAVYLDPAALRAMRAAALLMFVLAAVGRTRFIFFSPEPPGSLDAAPAVSADKLRFPPLASTLRC